MKIKITKELKALFLKALQEGVLDTDIFPELKGRDFKDMIPRPRTITKGEFRQIWEDFDKEY